MPPQDHDIRQTNVRLFGTRSSLKPMRRSTDPGPWVTSGVTTPCRSPRESVYVVPNGQGDTDKPECAGPGDQRDRAGAWRDQVMDSEAHECVRSTGWHDPPYRRSEPEQGVVDHEVRSEEGASGCGQAQPPEDPGHGPASAGPDTHSPTTRSWGGTRACMSAVAREDRPALARVRGRSSRRDRSTSHPQRL